jgi:predicted membrane-bound mannosyltransferase
MKQRSINQLRLVSHVFSYEAVALVLIFIASILLHLTRLGDMAMHHDESIHAWITWRFFTGAGSFTCASGRSSDLYCYDPVYHGSRSTFSPSFRTFCLVMGNGKHAYPKPSPVSA